MATVKIYLDTRAAKGEAPLKLCVNHLSASSFIPLNVKVSPKQWENASQMVVKHPNGKRINLLLSSRKITAERVILELNDSGELSKMNAMGIRDRIWEEIDPNRKKGVTFYSRLERYANLKTRKNTRDSYLWAMKKLVIFDGKIRERTFEDIGLDYLNELDSFYSDLAVNSKSILFRNIRTVFNDAIKAGITLNYPFRSFHIKNSPTRKKALTIEQVRYLSGIGTEYSDIFMLMFYFRGINIGDLLLSKKEQIVNGRFEYRRNKVGNLFSVKIEPEAMEILERYKGRDYLLCPLDRYKDYKDYLHHLNGGLKRYIPEVSSNWARHTWASIGIGLDIPIETISRGMGHSSGLKVTNIYIDYDVKKIDECNRKIIDAVKAAPKGDPVSFR